LFQQRKPTETKEWQQKLPDFVLRLEEAVYRGARTKVRFSFCFQVNLTGFLKKRRSFSKRRFIASGGLSLREKRGVSIVGRNRGGAMPGLGDHPSRETRLLHNPRYKTTPSPDRASHTRTHHPARCTETTRTWKCHRKPALQPMQSFLHQSIDKTLLTLTPCFPKKNPKHTGGVLQRSYLGGAIASRGADHGGAAEKRRAGARRAERERERERSVRVGRRRAGCVEER
jgi:hypothetical protein